MAEKDWLPPVGDWLAHHAGPALIELPTSVPEPEPSGRGELSGDQSLAESSAARVKQMLERRERSLSRPSSNRGLAAPTGSTPAAVLSRPARPLLPRSFPQHAVWPVKANPAASDAGKDLIASLQARLAHVEKLNQHQAAKITKLSQELNAEKAEKVLLRRALDLAEAEHGAMEEAEEDVEQEVQLLRSERDEYKEQVQAMTKFLRDYGLTWVGEEDHEDHGDYRSPNGEATVAGQLSRPSSALEAPEVVDVQAMTARVLELNGLVEGARVQRTKSHPGAPVHARFVADETLPLTFFKDGVKLGHCAFQCYNSRGAQQLIQDIMDGYFPYELKKDYPDGVMLKVIDRTADTYALWKEHASPFDRDLASDGDRLAVGQVLNSGQGSEKVVRAGKIFEVQERRPPGVGRVGSRPPDREVSLLSHTRSEKDPIARLQVRMDQDHRAVFSLELWQTVGHLEDAVEQWCLDEGIPGLKGSHLRTAFPPRSYSDRAQSMSDADLAPSATLFVESAREG
ncbi:unnamed protein product [Durusdinium trenchii]|uniref:UBX domain-containing protein 11 n=1 Tax=Durusdinium trenchii TaxID=1381693 RepID=A0ABP0HY53_9DINO